MISREEIASEYPGCDILLFADEPEEGVWRLELAVEDQVARKYLQLFFFSTREARDLLLRQMVWHYGVRPITEGGSNN